MTDFESQIFTFLAVPLRDKFPGIYIAGEYVKSPPKFPAVFISEAENTLFRRSSGSGNPESHAALRYDVDVYSNKTTGKKSEAKAILAEISDLMQSINFQRIAMTPVPNEADSTIFRYHAKFRAVIGSDGTLYRR